MPKRDISEKSEQYDERIKQWTKVRDCIEGEDQIKAKGTDYLPKPEGANTRQYVDHYLARAVFYGVSERTVRGMVGAVFRVEPTLNLPGRMSTLETRATPDGDSMDELLSEAVQEVVSLGRYGVLVDMPQGARTNPEPYFAAYTAENIWRWEEVYNAATAERVVVRIVVHEPDFAVDDETHDLLRELLLDPITGSYMQQLWIKTEAEDRETPSGTIEPTDPDESGYEPFGEPFQVLASGRPLDRIPFVFINTCGLGAEPEKPPLLDLANMNIAHYRNSADYEQALHITAEPTPWAAANWEGTKAPTTIGSRAFWQLPLGGQAGFLEFTGAGIDAMETAMKRKEDRMAVLGARLIKDDQAESNIAADTVRLQARGDQSVLISTVNSVERGFNKALEIAAQMIGASTAEVTLNKDFVETQMPSAQLGELTKALQAGSISYTTFWENLQRGEIGDPKVTADEERERIEDEGMAMPMPTLPADQESAPPDEEDDAEVSGDGGE